MVTLITEKLQNQNLDDLTCTTFSINLYSADKQNQSHSLFPFEVSEEGPWKSSHEDSQIRTEQTKNSVCSLSSCPFSSSASSVVSDQRHDSSGQTLVSGSISELSLNENSRQPLTPPTKRHCRSLSEPNELVWCRSPWKPGSSKIWTPVSKRRCNSGGSSTLQRYNSHGSTTLKQSSSTSLPHSGQSIRNVFQITSLSTSPVPRPSSASSGFVDNSEGRSSSSFHWNSGSSYDFNPRRRLSLSQEHIIEIGSACLQPIALPPPHQLSWSQGLLRCRSQPCVLNERKIRLKRRRDEDVQWNRPSLDFLKMTRTLKNTKSLCSLDYEDDDTQMKTIVSSPCNSNDFMNIITPRFSLEKEQPSAVWHHSSQQADFSTSSVEVVAMCESEEETSDCESTEEGIFPLDCEALDLEQIENN
ncbi:LOW QUALITY PROTEIN: protein FAM53A [Sceloporus undulatus]|uniref:LOW QUALITY PROTEIN: protein FAM53A n=1 Tax=Sceloporus undulatus TaxID=8520 RepID=UPI001C4D9FF2|nr:LOW QUALITY PROTEIN: protein FAM53A [Sceloporus undulatus]